MTEELDTLIAEEVTDELTLLKERADLMGITYHPSIGVEKLRDKINSALSSKTEDEEPLTFEALRSQQIAEFTKLIRIRLTCMDPNKKGWPGEIFTIANDVIGTIKRYVPYNAPDGWHVEKIIYDHIQTMRYRGTKEIPGPRGMKIKQNIQLPAFSIETLPPLTEAELKELAQRQALNHSIDY